MVTRRRRWYFAAALLLVGTVIASRWPSVRGGVPDAVVDRLIRDAVGDGGDPWVLAHACMALGDELTVGPDAVPAVDLLILRHGVRDDGAGHLLWGFPPPTDPHAYSYISELVRAPCDLSRRLPGTEIRRGDFVRGCSGAVSWHKLALGKELAWPLAAASEGSPWWEQPSDFDISGAVERGLDLYDRTLDEFLAEWRRDPTRRPVRFEEMSCGGHHLMLALVAAAWSERARPGWRTRVTRLLQRDCARVDAELAFIEGWADGRPSVRLAARSAVVGHHVEVLGYAARRADVAFAARRGRTLADGFVGEVRSQVPARAPERWFGPVWRDFLGGLCHARAGIRYLDAARAEKEKG